MTSTIKYALLRLRRYGGTRNYTYDLDSTLLGRHTLRVGVRLVKGSPR